MEGANLSIVTLFITFIGVFGTNNPTPPTWNDIYSVKAILHIPRADINEPIQAYFDGPSKRSRIFYYDDMVKTYQHGNNYGISLKIVPVTTEKEENVLKCFQIDGNENYTIKPQSILPSLEGFEYTGEEEVNGISNKRWELTKTDDQKVSKYKILVTYQTDAKTNQQIAVPIRYEVHGYNNLFTSHYDHYYLEYSSFNIEEIPESIFELHSSIKCHPLYSDIDEHIYTFNPIAEFIIPETSAHVDYAFEKFKTNHDITYQTEIEHIQRKEVFKQNMRFIHSTNRQNLGFRLDVNHLVDKYEYELKAMRGARYYGEDNDGKPFPYNNLNEVYIPEQFDWRQFGAISPVKDQGICGSCWSFSTIGAIEGAYFLHTGNLVSLSEQALVDCTWGYHNFGCDGGTQIETYKWIIKHGGVPTAYDYGQYLAQDGYCHAKNLKKAVMIKDWVMVNKNDERALRFAIFKHGPVSISLCVNVRSFAFYSRGVFYDSKCSSKPEDMDHAVLFVGYGSFNGENYWIMKNSWSNYWGNDGYMFISSKNNICGVMNEPSYVEF